MTPMKLESYIPYVFRIPSVRAIPATGHYCGTDDTNAVPLPFLIPAMSHTWPAYRAMAAAKRARRAPAAGPMTAAALVAEGWAPVPVRVPVGPAVGPATPLLVALALEVGMMAPVAETEVGARELDECMVVGLGLELELPLAALWSALPPFLHCSLAIF